MTATTNNLYERPVEGPFKALCGGGDNSDGTMEDCLSIAPLSGGGYALGDTKAAGAGRELRMSRSELVNAARAILNDLA
ncbi:hypothetical protein ABT294_00485 [Nonomuraea sp. NPDC000554]|uniref:hypothetical protein n=1 Tax=Nonomuraea sp. NPDC000554 TaxID=3154259 RepID=UPI003317B4E6